MMYGIIWILVAILTIMSPILIFGGTVIFLVWLIVLIIDITKMTRIPKEEEEKREKQKKEIIRDLVWVLGTLIVICASLWAADLNGLFDLFMQEFL